MKAVPQRAGLFFEIEERKNDVIDEFRQGLMPYYAEKN